MASLVDANSKMSAVQRKPRRMYITDLKTLETMEAQYNPETLEEVVKVVWGKPVSPGLSHTRFQYDHTDNEAVRFELIFDGLNGDRVDQNLDARNFLLSLCYAKAGAQNVTDGEAPRVLFVWPGMFSLTCVIDGELRIRHQRFSLDGRSTYFVASIPLSEIRDTRLFSEDVRQTGTERSTAPLDPSSNGSTDLANATGKADSLPTGNA